MTDKQHHFFASSVAMWATTNEGRDLSELLELMNEDGHTYNLFRVPGPHDAAYEIKMYQPMVKGTQWLGFYEDKAKRK